MKDKGEMAGSGQPAEENLVTTKVILVVHHHFFFYLIRKTELKYVCFCAFTMRAEMFDQKFN